MYIITATSCATAPVTAAVECCWCHINWCYCWYQNQSLPLLMFPITSKNVPSIIKLKYYKRWIRIWYQKKCVWNSFNWIKLEISMVPFFITHFTCDFVAIFREKNQTSGLSLRKTCAPSKASKNGLWSVTVRLYTIYDRRLWINFSFFMEFFLSAEKNENI